MKGKVDMNKGKKYLSLFLNMLYISAFTFGGGFVIVTLMKKKFVDQLGWIDEKEMLDMTAIAQSSPGAIAVNASILVGWKVGGVAGALVSVLGTVIPPVVIMTGISMVYQAFASNHYVLLVLKGMQAGVAAVIFDVVITMIRHLWKEKTYWKLLIMFTAFLMSLIFKINVVLIILGTLLVGVMVSCISMVKERKGEGQ